MSTTEKKGHTAKRLRGPDIKSIIRAAASAGRQLVGAVAKPNGDIEIRFEGDSGNEPGRNAIEA